MEVEHDEYYWLDYISVASESSPATGSQEFYSTVSSPCRSIISYDYNPDDFPRLNEIEEFPPSSFEWPPSSAVSGNQSAASSNFFSYGHTWDAYIQAFEIEEPPSGSTSRIQSPARLAPIHPRIDRKSAAKLKTKMYHLQLLLALFEAARADRFESSTKDKAILQAQKTLAKAFDFITRNWVGVNALNKDTKELVLELETVTANISNQLLVIRVLVKPIQLGAQAVTTAGDVQIRHMWYKKCQEVKLKAERLVKLLWVAARTDLYEQPARRIISHVEDVLYRTTLLVKKCCRSVDMAHSLSAVIPSGSFHKILLELENTICDVAWLLWICNSSSSTREWDDEDNGDYVQANYVIRNGTYRPLPHITIMEPILCLVWEQVAKLRSGSSKDKAAAAASLVSLARDSDTYGRLIIEEGGLQPLLKLVNGTEGEVDAQKIATEAMGVLGRDMENAKIVAQDGEACSILVSALRNGPICVQVNAAWAMSQLAANFTDSQDLFAQHNAVELLVHCLLQLYHDRHVDPIQLLVAMATKALCALVKGNSQISRSIVDSRLMLILPLLLEQSSHEVEYNIGKLLLEIARVAERDVDFRGYAFDPTTGPGTAFVGELLRIVTEAHPNKLLVTCIESLGCLSQIFTTTEVIDPLVRLLNEQEEHVVREALIALTKFTERRNYLERRHCEVIADGGKSHLAQLVYKGKTTVQKPAALLACYVASRVPKDKEIAAVVSWASKQSDLVQDATIKTALAELVNPGGESFRAGFNIYSNR